jgi:hypothetical protein
MPDASRHSQAGRTAGVPPDSEASRGRPRWLKVSAIVALVVVLVVVAMLVAVGGHGPGRH